MDEPAALTRPLAADVAAVRGFTRLYTQRMGVLHRRLLGTSYSVTEARVLLEIVCAPGIRASDVAGRLGLDPAYLSRILKRFAKEGLLIRDRNPEDGRGYRLRLTGAGEAAFADVNTRAEADVSAMLEPLSADERAQLVASLAEAGKLLGEAPPAPAPIVLREPQAGELGWIIHRHGRLYQSEFGWDETFEHIVIAIIAGYLAKAHAGRDRCWVADRGGAVVGSVFLEHGDEETAKLRLLYVDPAARGHGLGGRLVDECVRAARAGGYRTLTLWTMSALTAARRVYELRGFRQTASQPVRQFGQDLASLTYELDLTQ